jgi:malonate-semialdehyde dehydrogenase (acetylating)/methylmalonate-semialdehyde dehydrogenase
MLKVSAIFVGPARQWIPELVERAKNLKISGGFEEGTDMYVLPTDFIARGADIDSGPVISPQAKERIEAAIASVETQGGKILLDGRGCSVAEYPEGNFVGPTIVEVTTDMDAYKWALISLLSMKLMIGMKSLDRS